MEICFCDSGGLFSQCTAGELKRQRKCFWFEESSDETRCMNLDTTFENHCWSYGAQDQGLYVPDDLEIEEEIDLEEFNKPNTSRKCCLNCILFSCAKLTRLNQASHDNGHGGLTEEDLWNLASGCEDYDDEATISLKSRLLQRGIKP